MKAIFFLKYARSGASSRIRVLQYVKYFEEEGVDCHINYILSDKYIENIYSNRRVNYFEIFINYAKRLKAIFGIRKYNVVWVEKELFPGFPSFVELILNKLKVRLIVDYDDPVFHSYDLNNNFLVRLLLKKKIDKVMTYASTVIVGNSYISERAERAKAKDIVLVPSVIDIKKYEIYPEIQRGERKIIGWIGTPHTLPYLEILEEVFVEISRTYKISLFLCGVKSYFINRVDVRTFPWEEKNEVDFLNSIDIGIMPLKNDAWDKGKCGYKLIQYMACGKPVIASPIGINKEIVANGINGFLANGPEEWKKSFVSLINNDSLCKKMGRESRRIVEERYSVQQYIGKIYEVFTRNDNRTKKRAI
jgi:glycosyltransferase involved in cell wall biosynthesis